MRVEAHMHRDFVVDDKQDVGEQNGVNKAEELFPDLPFGVYRNLEHLEHYG